MFFHAHYCTSFENKNLYYASKNHIVHILFRGYWHSTLTNVKICTFVYVKIKCIGCVSDILSETVFTIRNKENRVWV